MSFITDNYRLHKKMVINQVKATHDWENTEGFIADGVINPEIYAAQPLKILVLLGESYGYSQCEVVDIENQPEEDVLGVGHHNRQTSKKVSALLWLLLESYKEGREFTDNDFPYLLQNKKEHIKELQSALSRAAWVNVKKASKHIEEFGNNATRQDYMEVYKAAIKNKDILRAQIEAISPELLIVCSYPVFDSLHDMKLLGVGVAKNKKYLVQINDLNQKVIQVDHPSYYAKWNYKGILKLYQTIYRSL